MDTVRIEWLLPDGRGAGRIGRDVVRVAGALPGDVVHVRREGRDAVLEAVITPGPDRVSPGCPWDAACGGCDLSALDVGARPARLGAVLERAFGLDGPVPVVPSPRPAGYRARIKLAIDGGRVGYRGWRSHDLVPIDRCDVARPELNDALAVLRDVDPVALAGARAVALRSDGARVVAVFDADDAPPDPAALDPLGSVAWGGRVVRGDPTLELTVHGVALRASPSSFFQVNLEANAALVAHVVDRVAALAPERVLDLYAGIGNLTLPVARATGAPAIAVELPGEATADLRHNAARAGLEVAIHGMAVERFDLARVAYDVAILDPPRAGAGPVLERVVRNRPRAVVYVSCNPVAAAREIRALGAAGYRLEEVRGFDLFPGTRHVEAVAVLRRGR